MTAKVSAEMTDSETAFAKINLALHVRKRLSNGYHEIDTIFAFLDCGDTLTVQEGKGVSLSIRGPFSHGLSCSDNLIIKAAKLLSDVSDFAGHAAIKLDKFLPVASGIGGGSADAAATLRLLNRFWETGYSLHELAEISAPLGADVPACVLSQTSIASGIGQDLKPLDGLPWRGYSVLLVNPITALSTQDVFNAWDGIDRGALVGNNVSDMTFSGRNDLQPPAQIHVPEIGDILAQLEETAPILSRMSGSGATCFGLYENRHDAEKAQSVVSIAMPEYWTMIGNML